MQTSNRNPREEITLRVPPCLHKWAVACALFYGLGLLVFFAKADFGGAGELTRAQIIWGQAYFVWQFGTAVLMMAVVCSISKTFKRLFFPLAIFSIIRLCLEIIAIITGMEVNNPFIVTILFLAALVACAYSTIIYSKEIWKVN